MSYEKAPSSGAFLLLSLMHFLSGAPMHHLSGVDKNWRRLDGHALLPKLILGVKFTNGLEVIAKASDLQDETAA